MNRISSQQAFSGTQDAGGLSAIEAATIMNDLDNDSEVKAIHAGIQELESQKSPLDLMMKEPREEWPQLYSTKVPELYREVRKAVTEKARSTAFRITTYTWLAGAVCAFGAVACAFIGGPANALGAAFIGALGGGTGAGRLYQWAANKWIIPRKTDKVLSEFIPRQHAILEQHIEVDRKREKQAIHRYATQDKASAEAGTGSPTIQEVDDEVIDVGGIKLRINKQSGLLQSIPLNKWGSALYTADAK